MGAGTERMRCLGVWSEWEVETRGNHDHPIHSNGETWSTDTPSGTRKVPSSTREYPLVLLENSFYFFTFGWRKTSRIVTVVGNYKSTFLELPSHEMLRDASNHIQKKTHLELFQLADGHKSIRSDSIGPSFNRVNWDWKDKNNKRQHNESTPLSAYRLCNCLWPLTPPQGDHIISVLKHRNTGGEANCFLSALGQHKAARLSGSSVVYLSALTEERSVCLWHPLSRLR